jgi:hypothetical protein
LGLVELLLTFLQGFFSPPALGFQLLRLLPERHQVFDELWLGFFLIYHQWKF